MYSTLQKTRHIFRRSIVPILFFEILFNGMLWLMIKPLFRLFIQFLISISGNTFLVNEQLTHHLFSVVGIVSILLVFFVSLTIIFYEFSVLFRLIDASKDEEAVSILSVMKISLYDLPLLFDVHFMYLAFYLVLMVPLLSLGVTSSLLSQLAIPPFIIDEVFKHPYGKIVYFILWMIALAFFMEFLFILPAMIFEKKRFKEAWKDNHLFTRKQYLQMGIVLVFFLTLWHRYAERPLLYLSEITWQKWPFLSVVLAVFLLFIRFIVSPYILNVVYVLYRKKEPTRDTLSMSTRLQKQTYKLGQGILKKPLLGILFFVLLIVNIWPQIEMDSIDYVRSHKPYVIGHRGSLVGVENTYQAANQGMALGADFVEIDVQLSKDQKVMVVHDHKLKRLSGKNKKIYELTANELQALTLKQNGYQGQILPFTSFRKKLKEPSQILIELKTHGYEEKSLVEELIDSIPEDERSLMLYQTAEIEVLLEMKEKFPNLKVGYIVIGKLGRLNADIITRIPADFYVFEESLVNEYIVNLFHRHQKEVFVWTVNQSEKAQVLYELGVDAVITDHPDEIYAIREKLFN